MTLSTKTEAMLDKWLACDTWHTAHDSDMNRWYDFIQQYQSDHGFTIDENGLHNYIIRKASIKGNDYLCNTVRERLSLAFCILDFLKHTGR
jgi:hypothetical protein